MRYIYLFFLTLSFTFTSYAQNDLIGEWFLHYIEVDGEQIYSTIPNSFNNIIFDADGFNGTVCDNGYAGPYTIIDETTLNLPYVSVLTGYCEYMSESNLFMSPYFWSVLGNPNSDNNQFSYSTTGTGEEEILVLTNSENNTAVYGRSPFLENRLPGIWFLHSITKDGVEEINTYASDFNLNFKLIPGFFLGLDYDGSGVCNNYSGEYYLNGLNELMIVYFNATLAICENGGGVFEQSYFSFLYESSSISTPLSYSVLGFGDDETLVLTDVVNGDFATYGRQTLSIEENIVTDFNIRLTENPVKSKLFLDISDELIGRTQYQIYSIDGKKIAESQLRENHSIDVNNLNSGMYFLQVSSEGRSSQIIKFIKH